MNKKINDIGYFIFASVIVIGLCIISIMDYINSVTNDENKVIISYMILGMGAFIFFIYIIKKYLHNFNEPIINMKDTSDGKKERKKYIINRYKMVIFEDIIFSLIFCMPYVMSGVSEFAINFIENIVMLSILTMFLAIKNYADLERKVKELNKD